MSAIGTPHVLETKAVNGRHLRCTFSSAGETFAHAIEWSDGDATHSVLTSVDGQRESAWPASPPWQELHVHEQADGSPAVMLVGRAGRSHWSMSVTVDSKGDGFLFDVACRLRETPKFLGNTYRAIDKRESLRISPAACGDGPLATVEERGESVVIDATPIAESRGTIRWAYVIARS